jgi:hypothetical protein
MSVSVSAGTDWAGGAGLLGAGGLPGVCCAPAAGGATAAMRARFGGAAAVPRPEPAFGPDGVVRSGDAAALGFGCSGSAPLALSEGCGNGAVGRVTVF